MPTCPKCLEEKPHRWFDAKGKLYPLCRECRRREADALRKRTTRAFIAGKDAALGAAKRRKEVVLALTLRQKERRLKTRFNQATATDRARLAVLEKKCDKTEKTLEAIKRRREHLGKYEQALRIQVRMVRAGVPPGDLLDWVDE